MTTTTSAPPAPQPSTTLLQPRPPNPLFSTLPHLKHLQTSPSVAECAIHKITVISSSKITQKVTQILRLLDFEDDDGDNANVGVTNEGTKTKDAKDATGTDEKEVKIIVAVAKADVASKLISVVEIVKREVVKVRKRTNAAGADVSVGSQGRESNVARKGKEKETVLGQSKARRLYQYCALSGIDAPVKSASTDTKMGKQVNGKKRKRESSDEDMVNAEKPTKTDDRNTVEKSKELGEIDEDDEEDDAFEPLHAGKFLPINEDLLESKKTHQIPVLTIYLSTEPVEVLKDLGLLETVV